MATLSTGTANPMNRRTQLEQAGVHFPIHALYPSLHLKPATRSGRSTISTTRSNTHVAVREALDALGEDPYGGMLTEGLARLEERIRQTRTG